jgi:hypothetical protein
MPPIDDLPAAVAEPAPPAAAAAPSPAPASSPEPVAAPVAEFKPHTDTKTLLQEAAEPAPAEPALAEAAAPVTEPKPEAKPEPEPELGADTKPAEPVTDPEPIAYPDLKLPDGVQADREKIAAFDKILGANRIPPETRQELADLHAQSLKAFIDNQQAQWHKAFGDVRRGWVNDVLADPQLGGAGHQTAMKAIARMRDAFVSSAPTTSKQYQAHRAAFDSFLATTGAGDNPAFLRFLHNVARRLDEPAMPPPEARPTRTNGADPNASRRSILYDNPASQTNR